MWACSIYYRVAAHMHILLKKISVFQTLKFDFIVLFVEVCLEAEKIYKLCHSWICF